MNTSEIVVHISMILMMVWFIKSLFGVRNGLKAQEFDAAGVLPKWGISFMAKACPIFIFLFALLLLDNVLHLYKDLTMVLR